MAAVLIPLTLFLRRVQTLLALAHWHTHDWKTALLIADEVSGDTKGKGKSPQDEDIITLLSWLYARLKKRKSACI